MSERRIKDVPFCWQAKPLLRKLGEVFSEANRTASARSVYLALSELASDNQSDSFVASIALIAHRSGVSTKWAGVLVRQMDAAGLVKIEQRQGEGKLKLPSQYTLTGTEFPTIGTQFPTIGTGRGTAFSSEKVEEYIEESSEELIEQVPPGELNQPEFLAAWSNYVAFRKKAKKGQLMPQSVLAQWARLEPYGATTAIEAINQTIANGYTGIFPEKIKRNGHSKTAIDRDHERTGLPAQLIPTKLL